MPSFGERRIESNPAPYFALPIPDANHGTLEKVVEVVLDGWIRLRNDTRSALSGDSAIAVEYERRKKTEGASQ